MGESACVGVSVCVCESQQSSALLRACERVTAGGNPGEGLELFDCASHRPLPASQNATPAAHLFPAIATFLHGSAHYDSNPLATKTTPATAALQPASIAGSTAWPLTAAEDGLGAEEGAEGDDEYAEEADEPEEGAEEEDELAFEVEDELRVFE